MGYNEADVVRLARPKGKKCRLIYEYKELFLEKEFIRISSNIRITS
jgi:hypothetical protein